MKKTWFSSDWHLDHNNILRYDQRPFSSIKEMNETIITNHNNLVDCKDDFYFLGDFCFNMKNAEDYLKRLKGNLNFIKGNHDSSEMVRLFSKYGTYLGEQKEIRVETDIQQGFNFYKATFQSIILNHYAMKVWNKSHHGVWHLFAHSHHTLPDDPNSLSIDVGCNGWNYKPLEFEDVRQIMSKKNFKPIDHHK